jgi:hypothetical protein
VRFDDCTYGAFSNRARSQHHTLAGYAGGRDGSCRVVPAFDSTYIEGGSQVANGGGQARATHATMVALR